MTYFTFTRDIPAPANNPSNDQDPMKVNFNSTDSLIAVDHASFNDNNGGYHTVIHQVRQTVDATPTANLNQLWAKNYTPDTTGGTPGVQLFSTNNGGTVQMTGTSLLNDGWAWSGGLLLQWGRKTGLSGAWPASNQTLGFKDRDTGAIPFPKACFMVTTTFIGPTSSSTGDICIISVSKENFVWRFTGSSSASYDGFYWFAVGN